MKLSKLSTVVLAVLLLSSQTEAFFWFLIPAFTLGFVLPKYAPNAKITQIVESVPLLGLFTAMGHSAYGNNDRARVAAAKGFSSTITLAGSLAGLACGPAAPACSAALGGGGAAVGTAVEAAIGDRHVEDPNNRNMLARHTAMDYVLNVGFAAASGLSSSAGAIVSPGKIAGMNLLKQSVPVVKDGVWRTTVGSAILKQSWQQLGKSVTAGQVATTIFVRVPSGAIAALQTEQGTADTGVFQAPSALSALSAPSPTQPNAVETVVFRVPSAAFRVVSSPAFQWAPPDQKASILVDSKIVAFGSHIGKYLHTNADGKVNANATWLRESERFVLIPLDASTGGNTVAVMSHRNKFCSGEGNGSMICNSNEIGQWERFKLRITSDANFALRSHNGKMLQIKHNGKVGFWGDFIEEREKLTIIPVAHANFVGATAQVRASCSQFGDCIEYGFSDRFREITYVGIALNPDYDGSNEQNVPCMAVLSRGKCYIPYHGERWTSDFGILIGDKSKVAWEALNAASGKVPPAALLVDESDKKKTHVARLQLNANKFAGGKILRGRSNGMWYVDSTGEQRVKDDRMVEVLVFKD